MAPILLLKIEEEEKKTRYQDRKNRFTKPICLLRAPGKCN